LGFHRGAKNYVSLSKRIGSRGDQQNVVQEWGMQKKTCAIEMEKKKHGIHVPLRWGKKPMELDAKCLGTGVL